MSIAADAEDSHDDARHPQASTDLQPGDLADCPQTPHVIVEVVDAWCRGVTGHGLHPRSRQG